MLKKLVLLTLASTTVSLFGHNAFATDPNWDGKNDQAKLQYLYEQYTALQTSVGKLNADENKSHWVNVNSAKPGSGDLENSNYDQDHSGAIGTDSIAIGHIYTKGHKSIFIGGDLERSSSSPNAVSAGNNSIQIGYGNFLDANLNLKDGMLNHSSLIGTENRLVLGDSQNTIDYTYIYGANNHFAGRYGTIIGRNNDVITTREYEKSAYTTTVIGDTNHINYISGVVVGNYNHANVDESFPWDVYNPPIKEATKQSAIFGVGNISGDTYGNGAHNAMGNSNFKNTLIGINNRVLQDYSSFVGNYNMGNSGYGLAYGSYNILGTKDYRSLRGIAYGYNNTVTANDGMAFGSGNIVKGETALSVGYENPNDGQYAVASGFYNKITSDGEGAMAYGVQNYVNKEQAVAVGVQNNYDYNNSTYGTSGVSSVAVGTQNKATNKRSVALGTLNNSTGQYTTSVGAYNYGLSDKGSAVGYYNRIGGDYAAAMGTSNTIGIVDLKSLTASNPDDNKYAQVYGAINTASGKFTSVYGVYNHVNAPKAITVGYDNINASYGSVIMGIQNNGIFNSEYTNTHAVESMQPLTTAVGISNVVTRSNSAAFGSSNIVVGDRSLALGSSSIVTGTESVAIGRGATVANTAVSNTSGTLPDGEDIYRAYAGGAYSNASLTDSVALGSYATTNRDKGSFGYNPGVEKVLDLDTMLKETNATMSSADVTQKQAELKGLQTSLLDKQKEKAEWRIKIQSERATDVATANAKVAELEGEINDINEKILEKEKELAPVTATWQGQLAALSVGDAEYGLTRQIINVAAGTEDTDAVNVAQLKSLAKKVKSDMADNTSKIEANTKTITDHTSKINTNTSNITNNTTKIDGNTKAISDNTSKINTNTSNISNNTTKIDGNTKAISDNTSKINTNTSNISDNTTKITTNTENIKKNSEALSSLKDNTFVLTGDNSTTTKAQTLSKKDGLSFAITGNKDITSTASDSSVALSINKSTAVTKDDDLLITSGAVYTAVNDAKTKVTTKDKYIQVEKAKENGLKGNTYILSFNTDALKKTFTMPSTISYKVNDGKNAEGIEDVAANKTVTLNKGFNFTNGKNTSAQIGEEGTIIYNLNSKLNDIQEVNNGAKTKITFTKNESNPDKSSITITGGSTSLTISDTGLNIHNKSISNVMDGKKDMDAVNVKQLKQLKQSLQKNISINKKAIKNNQTAINKNSKRIDTITESFTKTLTKIDANTSKIASNSNKITANTSAIDNNSKRISTNTSYITINSNKITANTNAIHDNTKKIDANTSKITSNSNIITANSNAIDNNSKKIDVNTSRITSNSNIITANTSAINENAKKIDTNASNIQKNIDQLATLKDNTLILMGDDASSTNAQKLSQSGGIHFAIKGNKDISSRASENTVSLSINKSTKVTKNDSSLITSDAVYNAIAGVKTKILSNDNYITITNVKGAELTGDSYSLSLNRAALKQDLNIPTTITYTANNGKNADGTDNPSATKIVALNKGFNFTNGKNISAQIGDEGSVTYHLNDTLNDIKEITNGEKAKIILTKNEVNPENSSVTIMGGNTALTIGKDGLSAGDKKITHVQAGTDAMDAVNVSQLQDALSKIDLSQVKNYSDQGDALSSALAALKPLGFDPHYPWEVTAGLGGYKGETALALGFVYHRNRDILWHGGLAFAKENAMWNTGVSIRIGMERSRKHTTNLYGEKDYILAHMDSIEAQNKELKIENQQLKEDNQRIHKELQEIKNLLKEVMKH